MSEEIMTKSKIIEAVAEMQSKCSHEKGFTGMNISCIDCGRPKISVLKATITSLEKDKAELLNKLNDVIALFIGDKDKLGTPLAKEINEVLKKHSATNEVKE